MTIYLHATTLVLATTAALAGVIAIWAATSCRHWFWRALAVWAVVGAMLPIRAYEPALVLGVALPLVAGVIVILRWRKENPALFQPGAGKRFWIRFSLRDALLLTALVAVVLATALHIFGRMAMQADYFRAQTGRDVLLPAFSMTVVTLLAWYVVGGRFRVVAAMVSVAVVIGFAWAMWPRIDWLYFLESDFFYFSFAYSTDADRTGFFVTLLGLAELAVLVGGLSLTLSLAQSRGGKWKWLHAAAMALYGGLPCVVYWQMLGLTPFPATLRPAENNYGRISEIAARFRLLNDSSLTVSDLKASNPEAATELDSLYHELLPLLSVPSAQELDLSAAADQQTREKIDVDAISAARALGRSLAAEAKAASARGDLPEAIAFSLATIEYGACYGRNGLMIDDLMGRAIGHRGYQALVGLRDRIDADGIACILKVLRVVDAGEESPATIIQRDMAYCGRMLGWQVSLSHVVERMTVGEPEQWRNFAPFVATVNNWRAINRLLQIDLAIRQFQKARGRLPQALEELIPEFAPAMLLDPFTNRPFVFRPQGENGEFILYSVGKDGRDDGGRFAKWGMYSIVPTFDLDLETLTRLDEN